MKYNLYLVPQSKFVAPQPQSLFGMNPATTTAAASTVPAPIGYGGVATAPSLFGTTSTNGTSNPFGGSSNKTRKFGA